MNEKSCAFSVIILRLITFISPLIKGRASSSSPPHTHVYLYSSHPLISWLYSAYPFSSRFLYRFQWCFLAVFSSFILQLICITICDGNGMEILLIFRLRVRVCGMNVSEHCAPNMASALLKSLWSKLWAQQAPAAAAIKCVREFVCACVCVLKRWEESLINTQVLIILTTASSKCTAVTRFPACHILVMLLSITFNYPLCLNASFG